jgi:hypothetical protein
MRDAGWMGFSLGCGGDRLVCGIQGRMDVGLKKKEL